MIKELYKKIRFDFASDRIGPDLPFTHWQLYFKNTMLHICQKKFYHFDASAEFRPGAYAIACSKISIGKRVIIRPQTMIFADPRKSINGYVYIEDNVMIGSGVHLYTSNHRYDSKQIPIIDQGSYEAKDVKLQEGCWIGANAIILPGVTIGKYSVIGAGSVVTKSIPDNTLAAGNPAQIIKKIEYDV